MELQPETPSDRELLSAAELVKQASEIRAWEEIAAEKGPDFMSHAIVEGDTAPYVDKIIVDVGCGPRPFLERFPVRFGYRVDCCMLGYQEAGLLETDLESPVICIDTMAERLPFRSGSVDFVFALNMLDHTFDPEAVVAEFGRVLRVGGQIHLHVDLGGEPNECEPTVFTLADLTRIFTGFRPIAYETHPASNPTRDAKVAAVLVKDLARGDEETSDARVFTDPLRSPDGGARLSLTAAGELASTGSRRRHRRDGVVWDLRPRSAEPS